MSEFNNSNGTSSEDQAQEINRFNPLGLLGFILALSNLFLIGGFFIGSAYNLFEFLEWMTILPCIVWVFGVFFSFIGVFNKKRGYALKGLIMSLVALSLPVFFSLMWTSYKWG